MPWHRTNDCFSERDMAAVLFLPKAKTVISMKNKNKHSNRRDVSVEKLQEIFAKLITEIADGSDSLCVGKGSKGLVIYVHDRGTLNLTYNEEGGGK